MDFKHPTNQLLLFIGIIAVMALLVVLSLWSSGDIYKLNCPNTCASFNAKNVKVLFEEHYLPL